MKSQKELKLLNSLIFVYTLDFFKGIPGKKVTVRLYYCLKEN